MLSHSPVTLRHSRSVKEMTTSAFISQLKSVTEMIEGSCLSISFFGRFWQLLGWKGDSNTQEQAAHGLIQSPTN